MQKQCSQHFKYRRFFSDFYVGWECTETPQRSDCTDKTKKEIFRLEILEKKLSFYIFKGFKEV